MNLRAMLAGDLVLLVGPPMPEKSMVRVQTKSSLPVLRVMRLGCGLITHSPKKNLRLRKPAMSKTEALRGMDTVTCETPEEVSHMMATGESQLEARGGKVSLANPKRNFRIGCWNVRTMFAGGRTAMKIRPYTPPPPLRCNEDDDYENRVGKPNLFM